MTVVTINHIEISPDIAFGKPRIAGTRITVQDIVAMHIEGDSPIEWIVENFDLTPAQIYAALSYYYDHKDEIDASMREAEEFVRENAIPSDEILAKWRARKPK